jgi:hypothetical protein
MSYYYLFIFKLNKIMYFHECFYVEKELLLDLDFPVITVNSFKFVVCEKKIFWWICKFVDPPQFLHVDIDIIKFAINHCK